MTKKTLIIILSLLGLIIISLLSWIYFQNNQAGETVLDTAADLPGTTSLPFNNQAIIQNQPVDINSVNEENKKLKAVEDSFVWVRILFTNENDASRRLQSYFDRTELDQKIILDKCNLASDSYCSADFKSALLACGLTAEDWSYLPLAFDRSTKRCYRTYAEIINYLNDELATVLKNRQNQP